MRSRHLTVFGLGIAAALVATGGSNAARGNAAAPARAPVVTLTTTDFRVAVSAEKTSTGPAPAAVVTVTTAQRVAGRWRRTGAHRLDETYFWNTVTGPRAVCRLELSTANARAKARPSVIVRLLLTPSLGCGPSHRYFPD